MNCMWFRQDLRVLDNKALAEAVYSGLTIGLYVEAKKQRTLHQDAECKLGFIKDSLLELRRSLNKLNIPLHIVLVDNYDDIPAKLLELSKQLSITKLFFNKEYLVNEMARDEAVTEKFSAQGIEIASCNSDLVIAANQVRSLKGEPYKVFTPYKKAWIKCHRFQSTSSINKPATQNYTVNNQLDEWTKSHEYRKDLWQAGESGAKKSLQRFLPKIYDYDINRDIPSIAGTSTLSLYLASGVISARQILEAILDFYDGDENTFYQDKFVSEIIWREFYRQIAIDEPRVVKHQAYNLTANEPWDDEPQLLQAWKDGMTGFPMIDAAMRQLKQTGWMHNRLRMNAAMFLNKLCLVDWRLGEQYFMESLIDGDFASNNGGWQWCSSTGADSAPYFRIMNPTTQSKRFDSSGEFIRKLVPELASCSNKEIHCPSDEQREALDYPKPVIDYPETRKKALALLR